MGGKQELCLSFDYSLDFARDMAQDRSEHFAYTRYILREESLIWLCEILR